MRKLTEEINYKFIKKEYNRYLIFIFSLFIVLLIGFIDYLTTYEISFSIFYLIPVSLTVLLAGFRLAIFISVLSTLICFLADIYSGHVYKYPLIPLWDNLVRLTYYMLHSFFLNQFNLLYNKAKYYSLTDPLSGAVNSRFFHELFERELKRANRSRKAFTLVYLDLDNFKCVNDTFGHATGDMLLKNISRVIQSGIRGFDVLARMGGDEFALLFPESGFDLSSKMIHRIKERIDVEMEKNGWPVTLSIGAVTFNRFEIPVRDMIKLADKLMYNVKRTGKNNIAHNTVE